jgi:subtilisin family serine protease
MKHKWSIPVLLLAMVALLAMPAGAAPAGKMIGINVVLNTDVTDAILADLGSHGTIREVITEIDVVTLQARESELDPIRALPYVAAANPDAERLGAPIDTVAAEDFTNGLNTWDLDAVNVTNFGQGRTIGYDGSGVYVAVLDTGLADSWRQYFPEERIAEEYAISFGGGGGEVGEVSTQPNKWEHDQHTHGTHVTSTILGYSLRGTPINGVAPMATVIPVKVLGNAGFGWSSMVAMGIVYVADLKNGPLADYPVVINMSLGGPVLDAAEQAAIDYAIASGVIVVAAAGNEGAEGMGYPGAYAPVISAAASGWVGEWLPGADGNSRNWWNADDVRDPTRAADFYITDFSSRELEGQDLDVAAPGSWVVGPFQLQSGQISYFFLGGTSMASPHVAGTVALMMQKNPFLTAAEAEATLEQTALSLPAGCRTVATPSGTTEKFCWDDDATGAGLLLTDAAVKATK